MKKSDLLKQQRAAKLREQQELIDEQKEKGADEIPAEVEEKLEEIDEEITDLDERIEKLEKQEEREARIARTLGGSGKAGKSGGEQGEVDKILKRFSPIKAIRTVSEGKELSGLEKEINDEALREASGLGIKFNGTRSFSIPARMVRATAQTVTEDSGSYGGKLVKTDIMTVDGFFPKLQVEDLGATVLTGLSGDVDLPVTKNFNFQWLAETGAVTVQKQEFDGPILKPKRAAAGVAISLQLLSQASVDVEAMIWEKLRQGAGRALMGASINGTGGLQPLGILNTPGVLQSVVVAAADPTWNHIVELPGLIEQADATDESLAYLLNPKLAANLRTIKKDAGSGRFLMEERMIDGQRTMITSLVPQLGTTPNFVEPLIYGDFSQLFVGQWGGVNFVVDPYTGAGSGEIRVFVNMYADVQIANPKGFAVNKFLRG